MEELEHIISVEFNKWLYYHSIHILHCDNVTIINL